jgi:hypothetical protein
MTIEQLYLFNALYLGLFVVIAILTRATLRRIAGAFAGAAVGGVAALAIVALGEEVGWWHMAITWEPYFLAMLEIDFAVGGFIFLITWRIARRFGGRGLAVTLLVAAVLGPVRDYRYMEHFAEWGSYAPGMAPVLAVSAAYVVFGVLGHAVMWLIAGPAGAGRLAHRPWEVAGPGPQLSGGAVQASPDPRARAGPV